MTARLLALEAPARSWCGRLPLAAVRELWEETGLMLGRRRRRRPRRARCRRPGAGFYAAGLRADTRGAALRLPRRHAAGPAAAVRRAVLPRRGARRSPGDDDFAGAGDELAHLQWLDLAAARALPLPFITEVVLSELEALLADPDPARPVPFFHQTPGRPGASACSDP